jgi:hypothetical protein
MTNDHRNILQNKLDVLISDIKTIKINEKNSDEKVIFQKVIELCFKHLKQFEFEKIFLKQTPEGNDNIINKENPYKIYLDTKMVVPNIPE